MKRSGLIILAIVGVLVLWGISTQRGLVGQDEGVKNAWNKAEKKKYIAFLRKNEHLFSYTLVQRKR